MTIFMQITDLHIDNSYDELKHINAKRKVIEILDTIIIEPFSKLIITGDISESDNGIVWLLKQLDGRKIKYEFVMGNHDNCDFYETNIPGNISTFKIDEVGKYSIISLDSSKCEIDQNQFNWLETNISYIKNEVVIFIHHPLLDCNNSLMDKKYPLLNRDKIVKLLCNHSEKIHVFCGHYHTEAIIVYKNIIQYVTPSTFYQLKTESECLEIENERSGYRIINLENDMLYTEVRYVN